MAYKYKKWKIKWQGDTKKFKKIKRDRKKSRDSYVSWRKNKGKMLSALRKSKPKRMLANKKNKARGMYKKLAVARKRWKNILKSDINLDNFLDGRLNLNEDQYLFEKEGPVIDIDSTDINGIITILKTIKTNHEFDDKEDRKEVSEFISDAVEFLNKFKDAQELFDSEEDFLEDILSFIEEYADDIGIEEEDFE